MTKSIGCANRPVAHALVSLATAILALLLMGGPLFAQDVSAGAAGTVPAPAAPAPTEAAPAAPLPAVAPGRGEGPVAPQAPKSDQSPSTSPVPPAAGQRAPVRSADGGRRLTIHLGSQRFSYSEGGKVVRGGPVSSGRKGYSTPAGSFRVLSKQRHKVSNRYAGSDGRPASMPYSIQFRSNYFIHQGRLPGYPASHGCVRLRGGDAQFLFSRLRPGDPVVIAR